MVSTPKPTTLMGPRMNSWSQVQSMPTPSPVSEGGAVDAYAGVYAGNMPLLSVSSEGTTPPLDGTPDAMQIISRGTYLESEYPLLKEFVEDGKHQGQLEYDINSEGVFRIAFSGDDQQQFEVIPQHLAMSKLLSKGDDMPTIPRKKDAGNNAQGVQAARNSDDDAFLVSPKILDIAYFEAQHDLISVYRYHPDKVETLKVFLGDGGRWGVEAQRFDQALSWLEGRVKEYEKLEREYRRTNDLSIRRSMQRLMLGDIVPRTAWLSKSPFHTMMLSYAGAAARVRADLLPLLRTLATIDVVSHCARGAERGGPKAIDLAVDYRYPEKLRRHVDHDFAAVMPTDIATIDINVSSTQQALRVKHADRVRIT